MIGKCLLGPMPALVMVLGLFSSPALAGDNAAAIKEFGVSKSEPIDKGFFFWNYGYVDAPYVVERRGLDIYINGHLVSPGREWPPYDETVDEDPGEPPPGSSPFDPTPPGMDYRDTYWVRKWRYLLQHHDFETAKRKLIELYRECGAFRSVTPDKEFRHRVVVVEKSGEETGIKLMPTPREPPPSKEEMLAAGEGQKRCYEEPLRRNVLFVVTEDGGELILDRRRTLRAMEILLSDVSGEEKIGALEKTYFLEFADQDDRKRMARFKASPRLIQRVNRMKQNQGGPEPRKAPRNDAALAGDNAAAIREFGVNRGEPIDKSFFFWNYEYVEAPYVVERRGLDIYINSILVDPGPAWPPHQVEAVDEDPGDPPPDSSPFDPTPPGADSSDNYWSRKLSYLYQHHDHETAKKKMFEAYKKCTKFRKVAWEKDDPDCIIVVHETLGEVGISLMRGMSRPPLTRQSALAEQERVKDRLEKMLRATVLFAMYEGGGECTVGGKRALEAMNILLSDLSDTEKIEALEKIHALVPGDKRDQKLVTQFKATRQLIERFKPRKEDGGTDEPPRAPLDDVHSPEVPPAPRPASERRARNELSLPEPRF